MITLGRAGTGVEVRVGTEIASEIDHPGIVILWTPSPAGLAPSLSLLVPWLRLCMDVAFVVGEQLASPGLGFLFFFFSFFFLNLKLDSRSLVDKTPTNLVGAVRGRGVCQHIDSLIL